MSGTGTSGFRGTGSPQKNQFDALGTKATDVQLNNEIKHLKQELSFQINLNNRISKELVSCQRRLGVEPGDPRLKMADDQNTQFVASDLSYMAPLFTAYDERIHNLDEMVDTLIDDFKQLDQKTIHLVEDNQFLRNQLEQKNEQLIRLHQSGGADDSIQGVFNRLEKEELNERIRLLNEENHIYIKKVKEYENKIYELQNRLEIYSKHEPTYLNEIHDLQEQVRKLEIDSDDLRIRRDVLENKLKNQIELNALQEDEKNEYHQKLSRAENELKVLKHQIGSLRHALVSSNEGQSQQLEELHKELESVKLRERDFFNKQVFSERELDQVKDDNRRLRKEVELTKADLDQTMKMMDNYENKISVFSKKEENITRNSKDLRERCEQINLEKDKLEMREQHFDQTLQNLLSKQREETHQLKAQNEKSLDQTKSRSRTLIEQRDDDIHRLNEEITQLTLLNEKLTKDNKSIKLELNRLENNLRADIENNHQQTDDLLRQITELTEKLQLSELSNQDNLTQFQSEKAQIDSHLKNAQNSNADLRQALDHTRTQLTSTTQELSTLKGKIAQLTRSNQALIEELQKTKKYNEQRLEGLQDEYTYKLKNTQLQLDEAVKREKNSRERAVQLLQQYDQIEEKLKNEFTSRIQELEHQLSQTRNQNKALQTKASEYGTLRK